MSEPISFEAILNAQKEIYAVLAPLPPHLRDRILSQVAAALNDKRVPLRLLKSWNER
jgi:hypothetical protein